MTNYVSFSALIVSANEFFFAPLSSRSAIGTVLRRELRRNFFYRDAELFGLVFYERLKPICTYCETELMKNEKMKNEKMKKLNKEKMNEYLAYHRGLLVSSSYAVRMMSPAGS